MPWVLAAIAGFFFLRSRQTAQPAAPGALVAQASPLGQITVAPQQTAAGGPPNVLGQQAVGLAEKTGLGLGTAAGGAAFTGASVTGALATGLETAGIGAAVFFGAEAVTDLFKCGTIGQRGCQKRSDAKTQITGIEAMKRVMYAVETGQATVAQAASVIQSIANQIYAAYENKASGNTFGMDVRGTDAGIPTSSLSAAFMLGQQTSLTSMTQAFIGYLPTLAAAYASGVTVAAQTNAPLLRLGAGMPLPYDPLQAVLA